MSEELTTNDALQQQISDLKAESDPWNRATKVMAIGKDYPNLMINVDYTIGKLQKNRWICPGDAISNDEQFSYANAAIKMEQVLRHHSQTVSEVRNFDTNEERQKFMEEKSLILDLNAGYTGCFMQREE